LLGLAGLCAFILKLELPMAQPLVLVLLVPTAIILLLTGLPEFSRIYQAASGGRLFRLRARNRIQAVPELVRALWDMSCQRVGALVVVPRQDPLDDFVQGGEEVDASLNRSLLLSIFDTHSPRHDGATILAGDRIMRIGAVLPLATTEGRDPQFGTRHLAALGLTEKCDADVLVVSEERGTISHARNGVIAELDAGSPENLQQSFEKAMGLTESGHRPIEKPLLTGTLWAMALLLSVLGSLNIDRMLDSIFQSPPMLTTAKARVTLVNLPASLYVEKLEPTLAEVYLQVPNPGRITLPEGEYTVALDASNMSVGTKTVPLSREMLRNVPKEWLVERFMPEEARIVLAEARELTLRIKPRWSGLPDGFRVVDHRVVPETIKAVVRDSSWRNQQQVETRTIDLSGISSPGMITRTITIELPASVQVARDEPSAIQVILTIESMDKAGSRL